MTVKRYEAESDPQDGPCSIWMEESAEGHYVTYSDYQKMAAENAALKKFIVDECVIPHEFYGDNKDAADFMPETPTTDAAIAEIKLPLAAEVDTYRQFIKDLGIACSMTAPETDHLLNHYKAQGVDMVVERLFLTTDEECEDAVFRDVKLIAANLRAGRKG